MSKMNGRMLSAAEILASGNKLHLETVATPEWGGPGTSTYIRRLSGLDAGATQKVAAHHVEDKGNEGRSLARWCILGCCDKGGAPIFKEEQLEELIKTPMAALQRCTFAIMRLNGVTAEEGEKKTATV